MKKQVTFAIALMTSFLLIPSCNQTSNTSKSADTKNSSQKSSAKKTITENLASNNYKIGSTAIDISQEDPRITAEIQKSLEFQKNISTVNKPNTKTQRTDEFYKCGMNLTHGYISYDTVLASDKTLLNIVSKFKATIAQISSDVKADKIGKYEPYSAARDKDGHLFVFFTTHSNREVFYTLIDPNTGKWLLAKSLTGDREFRGLATASFDKASQKIKVQVFNFADKKMYTYTQGENASFQKEPNPVPSTQDQFDELQAKNGADAETNYAIIQNSIPKPSEASSSVFGRVISDIFTIGGAEIANAVHEEEYLQASEVLKDIQSKVCPQ